MDDGHERLTAQVRGQVQGVGFRWWARARALELGLAGSATNCADGRVEVVAEGSPAALDALAALLGLPGPGPGPAGPGAAADPGAAAGHDPADPGAAAGHGADPGVAAGRPGRVTHVGVLRTPARGEAPGFRTG